MVCCAAWGCSNRSEKGVRMYGFPTDTERRKKWLAPVSRSNFTTNSKKICFPKPERGGGSGKLQWEVALRRDGFVSSGRTLLCSEHFRSEDFDRTGQTVRLKDGVVPTIFNFPAHLQRPEATRSTTTSRRAEDDLPMDLSQNEPQPNVVSILNVAKTREI
ncbi:THAP domain-containing protein 6-like [Notothenia coriiceps]|uniref:THAP domain-containing protein 6-like n=1 Tax=Notothenia coriiceps TaxID=8208 RepID=A0A6I9Q4A0_9TELE|nr:PREDICTED: THAP domain-containing protein 6-like [Notothenia coriiceps]